MKKIQFILCLFIIAITIPFANAGVFDWLKSTGKVTNQPVDLSINVSGGSAPVITVFDSEMTDVSGGLNEGPLQTTITIKFNAYDSEGIGNLNDSTPFIDFSKAGETTKSTVCTLSGESDANSKNYTCSINMEFWDGPGDWRINASISDLNGNYVEESSKIFTVGATSGFVMAPTAIIWAEINPGSINEEALFPTILNNTGNIARAIEINSTDMLGEIDNTRKIFATDMKVGPNIGCGGDLMTRFTYTSVTGASLPKGDYRLNDGTAQEQLFFCISQTISNLTQQSYSTQEEGAWSIRIA